MAIECEFGNGKTRYCWQSEMRFGLKDTSESFGIM